MRIGFSGEDQEIKIGRYCEIRISGFEKSEDQLFLIF
jgi:hypothetical protein